MFALLFAACTEPDVVHQRPDRDDTGDTASDVATWQFLVYLVGDNDLEDWVTHDLNELEAVGSGKGIEVLVQADRIDEYSTKDGDWTGTRRYRIEHDSDAKVVSSPVLEELGELDMGSPDTLADFLEWADTHYPAEHRVLIFWDHGDGWTLQATADDEADADADATAPPMIGSDDTSGTYLSFAEGTVAEGLSAAVERGGRYDVVGFDACNMASWEVAHSLVPYARAMSAAETTVGFEGFQYEGILAYLRQNLDATPAELADEMSRGAVEEGGEETHAATDLDQLLVIDTAIDELAGALLADEALRQTFVGYRKTTRGADPIWKNWYLDLGDLGAVMEAAGDPTLAPHGTALRAAVGQAVVQPYGSEDYAWSSGLTVWFDPTSEYIELYAEGEGATWSQDTRWGELMQTYVKR